jgi:hypothetical protein
MYKRIVFGHYDSNGDLKSRLSFPYTNSYSIFSRYFLSNTNLFATFFAYVFRFINYLLFPSLFCLVGSGINALTWWITVRVKEKEDTIHIYIETHKKSNDTILTLKSREK